MFIDSHLHLSKNYYDNIEKVVIDADKNRVSILIISCCEVQDIEENLEYVSTYTNVYLALGLHPSEAKDYSNNDIEKIEKIIKNNNKIIAIGEIGLDYYYGEKDEDNQKQLFIKQLDLARKLNMPVVIHTRDATEDTINILEKYNLKGVIHCFNGSIETAQKYVSLGYKLGVGGVVTFKNSKLYKVIEAINLTDIVLETDSPYLSPEPVRGSKNEPKNIPFIAQKIADIKGVSVEEVGKVTSNTVFEIFDLKNIK